MFPAAAAMPSMVTMMVVMIVGIGIFNPGLKVIAFLRELGSTAFASRDISELI